MMMYLPFVVKENYKTVSSLLLAHLDVHATHLVIPMFLIYYHRYRFSLSPSHLPAPFLLSPLSVRMSACLSVYLFSLSFTPKAFLSVHKSHFLPGANVPYVSLRLCVSVLCLLAYVMCNAS